MPEGSLRDLSDAAHSSHGVRADVSRFKRAVRHGRTAEGTVIALQQAAELVGRYPNLSEIELARLINLYRELSALDVALLISEDELAPKLGRFVNDHRSEVRTPFRQYAVLVAIAVAGIALFIWALIVAA